MPRAVLHILSTDKFSGAEKVAWQICRHLDRALYDVYAICNGGALLGKYRSDGLAAIDFNANDFRPSNLLRFKKIAERHEIRLVHAHGIRASIFAWIVRQILAADYRIISHVHESSGWLMTSNLRRITDRIVRNRFDVNILCGQKVYEHYLRYGEYIDLSRVQILSNAVESRDRDENEINRARAELDIGEEFVYGFVGRFSPAKGWAIFLEQLLSQNRLLEHARLILIGDGEEGEKMRRVIDRDKLRVILAGHKEDVYPYLGLFDLFLLPSLTEGLPMAVLEAMSAAVPVLAFNVGSVAEVIDEGLTGYLIEPGDYGAFFEAMARLKQERQSLKDVGISAREKIAEQFGIAAYMEKIHRIYAGLLDNFSRQNRLSGNFS